MSETGHSAELLSDELLGFCQSGALSEEGLREIIERHGLVANNILISDYKFFFQACRNEKVTEEMIQCLLEYFPGAATATGQRGRSPLHYACKNKNATLGIIQILIDAAPDSVRSLMRCGWMPLHILCRNRELNEETAIQILKFLLEKQPDAVRHADNDGDPGVLPIHLASIWGKSPEFCRLLIEAYPGSEQISNADGCTPLHYACSRGSLFTVKYLYKLYPAAIDRACTGGHYPIHYAIQGILNSAAFRGNERDNPATAVDIVQFLLNCDPNVKLQKSSRGDSLFHFACRHHYDDSNIETAIQIIKVLYDSYPEAIEDLIITYIVYLNQHPQVQAFIIKELVYARQARDHRLMTAPDDHGRLPLHLALQNNATLGSIKLLVKGNPHAAHSPDNSSLLPLHIACEHHDSAGVVEYLVELDTILGLDATSLGVADREGNTALHYACLGAKYDTIALLLEKYDAVSVSMRNAQNKLPIELLWESNAVEDRESVEYTDSVFRLLKAYPETLTIVGTDDQPASTARSGWSGNGKKSCRKSFLTFFRKAMRSSRKRVQNRQN